MPLLALLFFTQGMYRAFRQSKPAKQVTRTTRSTRCDMPLPLMPGSEPLPEIKPAPEAPPTAAVGDRLAGVGGALAGCDCGLCNDMRREYSRLHGNMTERVSLFSAAYGSAQNIPRGEVSPQQAYNASMENIQRQAFAVPIAPFNWGAQEAPRAVAVNAGRIRGRYECSAAHRAAALHGEVRWREPGTLDVFDDSIDGHRQWTFTTEHADGSLSEHADGSLSEHADGSLSEPSGLRWVPTEV